MKITIETGNFAWCQLTAWTASYVLFEMQRFKIPIYDLQHPDLLCL